MTMWAAAHGWFLLFLSLSTGTLALSVVTRQKWAAVLAWAIIGNQLLYQWAIDMFDAPVSLFVPMIGDCLLALGIYRVYERHAPGLWSVAMFLVQFTICLADWLVAGALTLPGVDRPAVLFGFYLSANILWLLLVACNAGPGAKHVAVHLRDHLHRAGATGSLARLILRR